MERAKLSNGVRAGIAFLCFCLVTGATAWVVYLMSYVCVHTIDGQGHFQGSCNLRPNVFWILPPVLGALTWRFVRKTLGGP